MKKSIFLSFVILLLISIVISGNAQESKQKFTSFAQAAASRNSSRQGNRGGRATGDTLYNVQATWSYSMIGLDYDASQELFWTAHESQTSSHNPTIYSVDTTVTNSGAVKGVVIDTIALSEENPGWPWQIDNRDGVDLMPNGNLLLPDYNGDLSYADDNIVEITPDGIILNAWEMDDEVGSNDSSDDSKINRIIDIAVIDATDDTIHAYATAAYDDFVIYEIKLTRTGNWWTPNSWYTVKADTIKETITFRGDTEPTSLQYHDNLGIDLMADTLIVSDWDSHYLFFFDSNLTLVDTLYADSEQDGGYHTGVCYMEETNPLQIATCDFDADYVNVFETDITENFPPTISDIQAQSGYINTDIGPVDFIINDYETDPANLILSATSDNQTLVPDGNISFGGSDSTRTITITPAADETGTATITVTVKDESNATATDQFDVTVEAVGSFLYVNSDTGIDDAGRDGSESQPWATISYAITRSTDGDTIDVTGTITADGISTNYDGIQVTKDLTIQGQGSDQTFVQGHATDAASADRRCFTISSGKTVTIKDMTLRYGRGLGGGAIINLGTLDLENCVVTDNLSQDAGYHGGGVCTFGSMTISNCTIKSNTCSGGKGGGFYSTANFSMENTTISGNSSDYEGGGICLKLTGVNDATLTMVNCTISGNSAGTTHDGGGIYLWVENYNTLDAELTNVTIADNTCGGNGTGIYEYSDKPSENINLTITNSILSNGTTNNYAQEGSGDHYITRTFTICRDNTMDATGVGNMNDTDPLLGALADNGGDTQTHAIGGDSPAVDAGTPKGVPATDQRGEPRPQGYGYDIGAYERTPQIFFVNSGTGLDDVGRDGSIGQPWATISYAISRSEVGGGDVINVTGTFTGEGVATSGIQVTKSVTLQGQAGQETIVEAHASGATFADRRCFTIPSGKFVNIQNMIIRNGNAGLNNGGGILNNGNLILSNCAIEDNIATSGGGIYSDNTIQLTSSTISGNTCSATGHGGAIYSYYSDPPSTGGSVGAYSVVNLYMLNCTISGNTAGATSGNGGALYLHAKGVTTPTKINSMLTNVTIANNTCGGSGTGIYGYAESVSDSAATDFTLKNCIISNGTSNNYATGTSGTQADHFLTRTYTLCTDNSMDATGDGNINNTDSMLGLLADNGGETRTHALMTGSPAIGTGTDLGILHSTDQRGFPHIGATDMGSYEYGSYETGAPDNIGTDFILSITVGATLNVNDGDIDLADLVIPSGGSGSASMVVERYLSQHPQVPNGVNFWWNITVTGNWTADLKLYYGGLDLNGIAESDLHVWHWDGSDWFDYTGTVDEVNDLITVTGLGPGDFSPFTLGDSETPLPVELTDFYAEVINGGIQLHWSTASEMNNAGFKVYRKDGDLPGFQNLEGLIPGAGTTSEPQQYSFTDKDVQPNILYTYQIADIEEGTGKETLHPAITIMATKEALQAKEIPQAYKLHANYPNPFNPETVIEFEIPQTSKVYVAIYDASGKLVKTLIDEPMEPGYHSVIWDGKDDNGRAVNSGVYIYKMETERYNKVRRCILLK